MEEVRKVLAIAAAVVAAAARHLAGMEAVGEVVEAEEVAEAAFRIHSGRSLVSEEAARLCAEELVPGLFQR